VLIWCPGCDDLHGLQVAIPAGATESLAVWTWDGNLDAPTFSPSLLCHGQKRCHSFIKAGQIQFLADCEHALAGQTVPLPALPEWV
jgi:hypothetical protein